MRVTAAGTFLAAFPTFARSSLPGDHTAPYARNDQVVVQDNLVDGVIQTRMGLALCRTQLICREVGGVKRS